MEKNHEDIGVEGIKTAIPKTCICPDYAVEQSVIRDREYLRKVKGLSLEKPSLFLV